MNTKLLKIFRKHAKSQMGRTKEETKDEYKSRIKKAVRMMAEEYEKLSPQEQEKYKIGVSRI